MQRDVEPLQRRARKRNVPLPDQTLSPVVDSAANHLDRGGVLALQRHLGNHLVARILSSRSRPTPAKSSRQVGAPARVIPIQRQPKQSGATVAKPAAVKDRASAEAALKQRWKVGSVIEGSVADQAKRMKMFSMDYFNAPSPPGDVGAMLVAAGWKAWSPATGSPVWPWLIEAFENFDKVFGGVPEVRDIAFYETDYHYDSQNARLLPGGVGGLTGADFGGGHMAIYHAAESQATVGRVATRRSTAQDWPWPFAVANCPGRLRVLRHA